MLLADGPHGLAAHPLEGVVPGGDLDQQGVVVGGDLRAGEGVAAVQTDAEAAAGGVDTRDVNPRTLESRKRPGLYFAGEVLDVTGLLGGYNLHWAWASGKAVGESWKKTHD